MQNHKCDVCKNLYEDNTGFTHICISCLIKEQKQHIKYLEGLIRQLGKSQNDLDLLDDYYRFILVSIEEITNLEENYYERKYKFWNGFVEY